MGWIKNVLRRPKKYPGDGARTSSNVSLSKANGSVLVRVPEEWPSMDATVRQSVDDAYQHAAALEAEASDDSASSSPRAGVYGPDGYELVGQLGTRRTSCLKLMRNRRTKELVVARCVSREPTKPAWFVCYKNPVATEDKCSTHGLCWHSCCCCATAMPRSCTLLVGCGAAAC